MFVRVVCQFNILRLIHISENLESLLIHESLDYALPWDIYTLQKSNFT